MPFSFPSSLIPLIIGGIIPGWLSIYVWRKRKSKGAKFLAVFMMLLFFWGAAYILELASTTLETKIFWNNITFIFIAFTPLSFLLFSIEYTDRGYWLTPLRIGLALLLPISTLIVIFTPVLRPWFWVSQTLVTEGDLLLINGVNGWWYWNIHAIYSYLGLLGGVVFLVRALLKWPRQYRGQMIWTLVAISVPWAANAITIFKILPVYIDLTPFAFSITGLGLTFAVVRHRMLDLAPIAREVVVDGLPDGVLILDADSRIVDANLAASKLLSLKTDVIGHSTAQIFSNWPEIAEKELTTMEGQAEIELANENGEEQYLEISYAPLHDRFKVVIGGVVTIRNITQAKETQNLLMEAHNKAVEANQLKSRFLAKVSHELRTPLGGIIGYTELLESETFGALSEEQKRATQTVLSSAQHLNDMVSELLDQAQIESGSLILKKAAFSLNDLMENSLSDLVISAEKKNLSLQRSIDPNLPSQLIGDERRLRQVIINLVANAIKFTSEGKVETSFLLDDADHWNIIISDTGVGIPEDALSDIFDPFKQVSSEVSHDNRGVGLGLSITRDLVALMDGSINVKSELNEGTVFRVSLPLERAQ